MDTWFLTVQKHFEDELKFIFDLSDTSRATIKVPEENVSDLDLMGRDEKGCKMDVDEHRPLTGLKSAVWSTSTMKCAVALTSTVDGQSL